MLAASLIPPRLGGTLSQQMAGKILKGLYSGAVACLGILSTTLQGNQHFSDLTDAQWTSTALFSLVAFGGTFGLAGWAGPKIDPGEPKP